MKRKINQLSDPDLQKIFLKSHRYGPNPKELEAGTEHSCLYTDDFVRDRVTTLFPKPNFLTLYEGENKPLRSLVSSFFNRAFLSSFQVRCVEMTQKWLAEMVVKGKIPLFQSVSALVAHFVIEGIMGYTLCHQQDLQLQSTLWKELFKPEPSALYHTAEEVPLGDKFLNFFSDIETICSQAKHFLVELKEMQELSRKIIQYGCSSQGQKNSNLPHYLFSNGITGDLLEGTISMLLLAAQETTSYLLGFILYEFAASPELSAQYSTSGTDESFRRAMLEGLRKYPTGGALRKAGVDMIVEHNERAEKYYIHKQDFINCVPYVAGHDASQWNHPEQFDPERKGLSKVKERIIPFGHGAHRCVGEKAAEVEMLAALSTIVMHAKLTAIEPLPEVIDAVVVKPLHDVEVLIEKR